MSNAKALKQLNTMMLLTLLTQIVMLITNALIASNFGVSTELDAFNLTKTISTFTYSFIGAGVSTVVIPFLREKTNKKALNIFITSIYVISFMLLIFMIFFRESIIIISSGSNDFYFINLATNIFIYTIVAGFLNAFIPLLKAIMEFNGKFNIQKLIVFIIALIVMVSLFLIDDVKIHTYAMLLLSTTILSVILHTIYLRSTSFEWQFDLDFKNQEFKKMFRMFLPTMLSTGVYQISLLIDTLIAARLETGSISILNYSSAIISMINMLLLGNLTSFVYPRLVKEINVRRRQKLLADYVIFISLIMLIISSLFFNLGEEGISVLFERGKFTSSDTRIVFLCGLILALSLTTNGIRDLLYRYFYINQDTFTPFINSIIISFLNIVFSLILVQFFDIYGVVMGTSLASFLSLYFITSKMQKKFPLKINFKTLIYELLKLVLASIFTTFLVYYTKGFELVENKLLSIFIFSILSIIIYLSTLFIMKSRVFKIKL